MHSFEGIRSVGMGEGLIVEKTKCECQTTFEIQDFENSGEKGVIQRSLSMSTYDRKT